MMAPKHFPSNQKHSFQSGKKKKRLQKRLLSNLLALIKRSYYLGGYVQLRDKETFVKRKMCCWLPRMH